MSPKLKLKYFLFISFFLFFLFASNFSLVAEATKTINITPEPQSYTFKDYDLTINNEWTILSDTTDTRSNFNAKWLKDKLVANSAINLKIQNFTTSTSSSTKIIVIGNTKQAFIKSLLDKKNLEVSSELGADGYILETYKNPDLVIIAANESSGSFYGVQSLLQLINKSGGAMPGISIIDYPSHQQRGISAYSSAMPLNKFDVSGKSFSLSQTQKDVLDRFAANKINLVILSHSSNTEFFSSAYDRTGFKDLVEYARDRYIEIIPALGSIMSIPGIPFELQEGWWIKDEAFTFDSNDNAIPDKKFTNLISNGGFESGLDTWTKSSSGVTIDSSQKYAGSNSVRLNKSGNITLELPAEPNSTYYATMRAKGYNSPYMYVYSMSASNETLIRKSDFRKNDILTSWSKFGVTLRTGGDTTKIKIVISYADQAGTDKWANVDEVKLYRLDGALLNVIRTNTTDIKVQNKEKNIIYEEGRDYQIENGATASNVNFSESLKPFQIKRLANGNIPANGEVLVDYDGLYPFNSLYSYYNQPCLSDERVYTDYYYLAIDRMIDELNPEIIMFNSDESGPLNRDSRSAKRGLTNAKIFAEWANKINNYIKRKNPNIKMMIWDDMPNPYHNSYEAGENEYQISRSGPPGKWMDAVTENLISDDIIMAVWWYSNDYVSHIKGSLDYWKQHGYKYYGAPWYELDTIKNWSEFLYNDSNSLGIIDTTWGTESSDLETEEQFPYFYNQAWHTEYKTIFFDSFENDNQSLAEPLNWESDNRNEVSANLLTNGSFENSLTSWQIYVKSNGFPKATSDDFYDGSGSVHFLSTASSSAGRISQLAIPIEGGESYEWSMCGKGANISLGSNPWYKLYGAGRFSTSTNPEDRPYGSSAYMIDVGFPVGSFDWQCVKSPVTAPLDAKYFSISSLGILGNGTGEAWVDKVSMSKYVPPFYSCNNNNAQGGAWGNKMKCVMNLGDNSSIKSQAIKVKPNNEYNLSVYLKKFKSADSPIVNYKIIWLDNSNKVVKEDSGSYNNLEAGYKMFSNSHISPAGSSYAKIYFSSLGKYVWLDTVKLNEKITNTISNVKPSINSNSSASTKSGGSSSSAKSGGSSSSGNTDSSSGSEKPDVSDKSGASSGTEKSSGANDNVTIKNKIVDNMVDTKSSSGQTNTVDRVGTLVANTQQYARLKGKIILKVESKGEAYYVNPNDKKMYSLGRPDDAFSVMRKSGIGITNADLNKIKIGYLDMSSKDTDGDGLPDMLEDSIGTDKNKKDTDGDGYDDMSELLNIYNANGSGKISIDSGFTKNQVGKIFIQVEGNGEAWYVNPGDNKRYFLGRPADAFNVMRKLGLGISNGDFEKLN